jgi:hypothetical protein
MLAKQHYQHFLGINCVPYDYTPVANQLGLASLAECAHKHIMGANLLKGLLDCRVDSPYLFSFKQ